MKLFEVSCKIDTSKCMVREVKVLLEQDKQLVVHPNSNALYRRVIRKSELLTILSLWSFKSVIFCTEEQIPNALDTLNSYLSEQLTRSQAEVNRVTQTLESVKEKQNGLY